MAFYEHENYYLKMNRVYPKTGLPIYNKHTEETLCSLYISKENDFLYLNTSTEKHLYSKNLNQNEFYKILSLARKHAIEANKNLFISDILAERFDVQNFVLHHASDDQNHVVPMTNEEILRINQAGKYVQVKPPRNPNNKDNEFYITKSKTHNNNAIFERPYIVSSGKIIYDVNNSYDAGGHIYFSEYRHRDFSNIVLLENSGDNHNYKIVFPAGHVDDSGFSNNDDSDSYKFPQKIDNNVKTFLKTKEIQLPTEHDANKNHIIPAAPTNIINENKHIHFDEGQHILQRTIEFIKDMKMNYYHDSDIKIKLIDNLINLHKKHPYLFVQDGKNADSEIEQIKSLRSNLTVLNKDIDLDM